METCKIIIPQKEFVKSYELFKRDSSGSLKETFDAINAIILLKEWAALNSDVKQIDSDGDEIEFEFIKSRTFPDRASAVSRYNRIENSDSIRSYIYDNFSNVRSALATSVSNNDNIENSYLGNLIGYCIENDETLNPSQLQFFQHGDEKNLITVSDISNLDPSLFSISSTPIDTLNSSEQYKFKEKFQNTDAITSKNVQQVHKKYDEQLLSWGKKQYHPH